MIENRIFRQNRKCSQSKVVNSTCISRMFIFNVLVSNGGVMLTLMKNVSILRKNLLTTIEFDRKMCSESCSESIFDYFRCSPADEISILVNISTVEVRIKKQLFSFDPHSKQLITLCSWIVPFNAMHSTLLYGFSCSLHTAHCYYFRLWRKYSIHLLQMSAISMESLHEFNNNVNNMPLRCEILQPRQSSASGCALGMAQLSRFAVCIFWPFDTHN